MSTGNYLSHIVMVAVLSMVLTGATGRASASVVNNGGLEDTGSVFAEEFAGYMSLSAGSTAIDGWTVDAGVSGSIAWGNASLTGIPAAEGSYFVDLTGLGAASPNGAITQSLNTVAGQTYVLSFYIGTNNDANIGAKVDGVPLTLSTPLGVAPVWTYTQATFVAPSNSPVLEIANTSGGGVEAFVDAVSVAPTAIPEPASAIILVMLVPALRLRRGAARR